MASSLVRSSPLSSCPLTNGPQLSVHGHGPDHILRFCRKQQQQRVSSLRIQATKLPEGVIVPKEEPKFQPAFLGFTRTAEIWNSRACMIGLIGVFIIELILNKGILQVVGIDIGKGLDLPL